MKKPAIPSSEPSKNNIASIKENIEIITGRRGTKIISLPANASLSDSINKINEIIELLQG